MGTLLIMTSQSISPNSASVGCFEGVTSSTYILSSFLKLLVVLSCLIESECCCSDNEIYYETSALLLAPPKLMRHAAADSQHEPCAAHAEAHIHLIRKAVAYGRSGIGGYKDVVN